MQQQGDDIEQVRFREAVEGMREMAITLQHWRTLISQFQANLPRADILGFDKAVRIFHDKKAVYAYNHDALATLGSPILIIKASHSTEVLRQLTTKLRTVYMQP